MSNYIRRTDAINTSLEFFVEFLGGAFHENAQKELIARFQRLQSVQPEIIRCKDCKYWSEYEYINGKLELFPWCELNMTFSKENDFCSHAERKPDE